MPQYDKNILKPHNHYYALQGNRQIDRLITYVWNFSLPWECWREIPGTDGNYHISNRGRVLSLCKDGYRLLKPFLQNGYYCVSIIYCGEGKKDERINVLVAKTFIPNPGKKPIVHHIDTDKLNNDVANLVWLTTAEHGKAHRILNQQAPADGSETA